MNSTPPLSVPHPTSERPALRPLSGWMMAGIVATIVVLTAGVVTALWWAGPAGLAGRDLVSARFDALRLGLSIGVGGGGVFALYLAWRRQQSTEIGLRQKDHDQADVARAYALQERVAADAADRRITELYSKSAEQLGSDKAPVRLAGLFALERLAQDNPRQRQTIVDLLCAYLRMPYTLPADEVGEDPDLLVLHEKRIQEPEVRIAAEGVLAIHLRPVVTRSYPSTPSGRTSPSTSAVRCSSRWSSRASTYVKAGSPDPHRGTAPRPVYRR